MIKENYLIQVEYSNGNAVELVQELMKRGINFYARRETASNLNVVVTFKETRRAYHLPAERGLLFRRLEEIEEANR